jgi:hypothetical protein
VELGAAALDFIKQFQTLLVGGLGFIGVMATIATNAWLARRQLARQFHHDTNALRIALRTELEMIRDALRDRVMMIDSSQPKQREGMFIPLNMMTDAYSQLIDRIGLLSETEIRAVMRAYLLVRQMPERLALLALQSASNIERAISGFIFIEGRHFASVKQMHKNYLTDIEQALSAIAR